MASRKLVALERFSFTENKKLLGSVLDNLERVLFFYQHPAVT